MHIREFEWRDHDAVVGVWTAAGLEVVPRAELRAKLSRDPELFLVAETGAGVVAAVLGTFDGRRGWVFRLAVHPAHRRQGIAARLVDELEKRFEALGCPRVNLLVMPDDRAGLRFWHALGYLPAPDVLCTKPMRQGLR